MQFKTSFNIPASLCIKCRSAKNLCGLSYCPILVSTMVTPKFERQIKNEVSGSSPPSVFVGRFGYPKIKVYPSTPPEFGETGSYETPKDWMKMDMEKFLSMRLSMLRGGMEVSVKNASSPDSKLLDTQLLSMASKPVDMEMIFSKSMLSSKIVLSEYTPPMGPAAPLKNISYGNVKIEPYVERAFNDTDLKAVNAIYDLYSRGIDVSRLSKILSTGAFGVKEDRRAVPTRWSITAVDKNVSDLNLKTLKGMESVDKFEVFVRKTSGNLFMGIMAPGNWQFEWGEAWFPGSTWNTWGSDAEVEIDYEGYNWRKDYPGIGGCYYASRLAATEYMLKRKRMAIPLLWREIYPGFNLPVGVWYVRENLREMFNSKPLQLDDIESCILYLKTQMKIPVEKWLSKSTIYRYLKAGSLDRYIAA